MSDMWQMPLLDQIAKLANKLVRLKERVRLFEKESVALDYRIAQIEAAELPRRFRELALRVAELEKNHGEKN